MIHLHAEVIVVSTVNVAIACVTDVKVTQGRSSTCFNCSFPCFLAW